MIDSRDDAVKVDYANEEMLAVPIFLSASHKM